MHFFKNNGSLMFNPIWINVNITNKTASKSLILGQIEKNPMN